MSNRYRESGSVAGPATGSRRREWNASAGTSSASTIANSKRSALSAAYAELGKELTSGKLRSIGTYTLSRYIGEGTYGKVRLGTHRLTGLRVAIKQVPKAHSANLTREIHHHRHLHHPNIMQLYEVLATESCIWMVSELCAGGELYDYLVERGTMPEPEARRIFGQLCLAVAYIHGRGVVHRDLKLENVLLDERCNVKLGDFGFTREFEGKRLMETFCGTTGYAAPEMLAGRPYTGEEVDVWSLGIILYALIYGELPFDDDDEIVMKAKILRGEFEVPDTVSPECISLIKTILQRDPTARPSIKEILSSPWFAKVILPPLAMETVDEDVTDFHAMPAMEEEDDARISAEHHAAFDASVDTAKEQRSGTSSGISNASFQSGASRPESDVSDHTSSNTDSTTPTTANGAMSEAGDEIHAAAVSPLETLTLQHRNESQTTIKRQASSGSDGSRKTQLLMPRSTSLSLATHVETPLESGPPDEVLSRSGLPHAPLLEKRGSQGSSRGQIPHRTPSRTKRRSSSGLSDHHPPSLEGRPVDYVALLERSAPAIFSTVLEQNLLHQLSTLGMDVGQVVHSVVNEACDASGALWWLLKKKEEEKRRIETEAGFGSVPSSPHLSQIRNLSPAPSVIRDRQRAESGLNLVTSQPDLSAPSVLEVPGASANDKIVEAKPSLIDATTATDKVSRVSQRSSFEEPNAERSFAERLSKGNKFLATSPDAFVSTPALALHPNMQRSTTSQTTSSPARSRAASLTARISNVLTGKDKEKEQRRDPVLETAVIPSEMQAMPSERSKGPTNTLLATGGNSISAASPSSPVETRNGKDNVKDLHIEPAVASTSNLLASTSPQKLNTRSASLSQLQQTKSIETFTTVSSAEDGETEDTDGLQKKKNRKSSFISTVRSWLGSEDKNASATRQRQQRAGKKKAGGPQPPPHVVAYGTRAGSIRRHGVPSPIHGPSSVHVVGGTIGRQSSRNGVRSSISRTSSSSSMHFVPKSSRPVSIRRQSAGSVTPTATVTGLADDAMYARISRPSSAQSQNRMSLAQSGLRGKSGSVGSNSSRMRLQRYSSGSGGLTRDEHVGSGRGTQSHRSSIDGGTTVRRHRKYPSVHSESRSLSRPSTPSKNLQQSNDFSVDSATPRHSIDSEHGSPLLSSRAHVPAHSVFVAHRSRNPYKPPSMSPVVHRLELSGENDDKHAAYGPAPSHARPRGTSDGLYRYRHPNPHVGSWRRSWGKPPPMWSGPIDQGHDEGVMARIAEAQARDKAKVRDIFARPEGDDEWEDEEDDPIYAGGLGQLASNLWISDSAKGHGDAHPVHSSLHTSVNESLLFRGPFDDRSSANKKRPQQVPRPSFQPPSLGRETAPRSWVPAPGNAASETEKDTARSSSVSAIKDGILSETGSLRKDGLASSSATNVGAGASASGATRIRSAAPSFKGPNTITEEEEDE